MLTKDDLNAIQTIVQTEVRNEVAKEVGRVISNELKKELKPVNKRLKKIEKDLSVTIKFFDHEHLHLQKLVDRIEDRLQLPPLPQ